MRLGATPSQETTGFVVWAPFCERVTIDVVAPNAARIELQRGAKDYFTGAAAVAAGAQYFVRPDNRDGRPDPASRFQPKGVHGPSEVVDPSFPWTDGSWRGIPFHDYVIYELHVGTFTEAGTFDAAIPQLAELATLGITAIEIMPVAQFPGARNWGYDGVQLFAVQNTYGGPAALKRFVDACHAHGLAVVLDVVYNHLGPEGNYLGEFGPYFTDKYKTPWGPAVNVDEGHSDEVRRFFIENALEWVTDYHIDALRLDAVHGILDTSAQPFLAELAAAVRNRSDELDRQIHLIAESDLNDVRMIAPHGMNMHAQWTDDFHHALHALITREDTGYYTDFGTIADFAESWRTGYVYKGQFSRYRTRRHGNEPAGARDEQFVVYLQNHDQVGNRVASDRVSATVDLERYKTATAAVLLSPFVPLIFMGDEYGETNSFPYFVDHGDPQLIEAVRKGRREEFAAFRWAGESADPAAQSTFDSARLARRRGEPHDMLRRFHARLLALRNELDLARGALRNRNVSTHHDAEAVSIVTNDVAIILAFSNSPFDIEIDLPPGQWRTVFCTRDKEWLGSNDAAATFIQSGAARIQAGGPVAMLLAGIA